MADSTDYPLPPANFLFLVESILMQAQMQLGLFNMGEQEKAEANLPLARHSIDLLAVLQQKTAGNLTVEEQRLLENGLTELRFRYIQAADEQKRKNEPSSRAQVETPASQPAAAAAAAAAEDDRPLIITADGGKGSKTD